MKTGMEAARARFAGLFPDRELMMRSGANVKFIRLSGKVQRYAAMTAMVLAGAAGVIAYEAPVAPSPSELQARQVTIAHREQILAARQAKLGNVSAELEARQQYLEELTRAYLPDDSAPAPISKPRSEASHPPVPMSAAEELAKLDQLRLRQQTLAERLRRFAEVRAASADSAIRRLGLNPEQLDAAPRAAMGGPLERVPSQSVATRVHDRQFAALNIAFRRMAKLEQLLLSLPGGRPAAGTLSSNYGYRSDPFTGEGAFHAGLDFPGPVGSPIYASAPGKVAFVGQRQGYGNVVEIDHGNGILTRYAHLSGFATQLGKQVAGGQQIARMGSTGRSTGSHLHFEVRVNGAPVNPRRFLEGAEAIIDVRNAAKQRIAGIGGA